jgi:GNAT superfamily N-acetyltransferase
MKNNVDSWIDKFEADLKVKVDRELVHRLYDAGFSLELPNIGFSLCIVNTDLLGNKVCSEIMNYLVPEARNIENLKQLMNFIEDTAKENGCNSICLGSAIGYNDDRVINMYKRFGYKPSVVRKEL